MKSPLTSHPLGCLTVICTVLALLFFIAACTLIATGHPWWSMLPSMLSTGFGGLGFLFASLMAAEEPPRD